jgi:uncharacterized membrane protein YhaH (DUF805 family)
VEKKAETVGPIGALKNFFLCYARFDGRSSRSEYWWMWLWSALHNLTFVGAAFLNDVSGILASILYIAYGIVALSALVPTLALGARRLRDAGFSPYLLFLFLLGAFGAIPLWVMYALPAKVELPSPPITAS